MMKNIVWIINGDSLINNDSVYELISDLYPYNINNITSIDTLILLEELLTCVFYTILTGYSKYNKYTTHKNYNYICSLVIDILISNNITNSIGSLHSIRITIINNNIHIISKWSNHNEK